MQIKITDIEYDFEGEGFQHPEAPSELIMELPANWQESEISDIASDYISDTTGFCNRGFKWNYE